MKKKYLTAILIATCIVSMTACSSNTVDTTNTEATETVATESVEESVGTEIDETESDEVSEAESTEIEETESSEETEIIKNTEETSESSATKPATEETKASSNSSSSNSSNSVSDSKNSDAEKSKESSNKSETASVSYTFSDINMTLYVISSAEVRKEPSTNADIVETLSKGQSVKVTGECNEAPWFRVSNGYVSANYLSDTDPTITESKDSTSEESSDGLSNDPNDYYSSAYNKTYTAAELVAGGYIPEGSCSGTTVHVWRSGTDGETLSFEVSFSGDAVSSDWYPSKFFEGNFLNKNVITYLKNGSSGSKSVTSSVSVN